MILTNSSSMNELIPFYQSFTCTDFQSLLESIAGVWLSSSQVYSLHVSFWLLNWWLIFLLFKRLQRRERPSEQADDDRRTCANQQWTSTINSYWHAPNMQQLWKQVTTVQNHKIRFTEKVLVTDILEKTVMKSWLRKKLDHDGSHYYYQAQPDLLKNGVEHASPTEKNSTPSPPLFFRAALSASSPGFDSASLGSSPRGVDWSSWFSLLSPASWLLSDFLSGFSLLVSFSLREGGGFFPLLLTTFCCCCHETEKPQQKANNYLSTSALIRIYWRFGRLATT